MSRWIYLSHFLDTSTPAYGGGETFQSILLLEDMDLSQIECNTSFLQVIVSPLLVEHADAAPCGVLAEVDV